MNKQIAEDTSKNRVASNRNRSLLRCAFHLSWGFLAATILGLSPTTAGWGWESAPPSGNAAEDYRRAFEAIAQLPDADTAVPKASEPLPSNEKSEQIIARLEPALKCLHAATTKRQCDWKNDLHRKGVAAEFPHLAKSQELAKRAIFRARYCWKSGRKAQAIDDMRAVVVLARHVGDEGKSGLVGLTERYKIEQAVVDVLCQWLADAGSARSLDGLCRLALQPDRNLPKAGLLLEREAILPWIRRLATASDLTTEEQGWRDQFLGQTLEKHGAKWILERADETQVHYTEVGELLDLPIDQFVPKFRRYLSKLDGTGNPFSQVAIVECPGIPGAYLQSKKLRAQWAILQAASTVLQRGPAAISETNDPYGKGPLRYEPLADGFTIRSALVIDGKPIELRFTRGVRGQQSSGRPQR